jgi:alkaline phosphatase
MTNEADLATTVSAEEPVQAIATSVILMIPDGFGQAASTAYRYFKRGAAPVWEEGFKALVQTDSADSPVTDSAAAATAFATGMKTTNGAIAVDVDGNPLVSVLDLASLAGKATGIVSTAAITDATPAAFAASTADRDDQDQIAQQYIDNGDLDVILGGGLTHFSVDADGDGATTLEEAQAAGFAVASTRDELLAAAGDRLIGLFSDGDLSAPIGNGGIGDRPPEEPSLSEMTEAALARLSQDEDGFFLLVEEEGTDLWGHANDAATLMNAARSYEDAVKVALDYAEAHPGTLVISVADHETGGMTLDLDEVSTPFVFRKFEATYEQMLVAVRERVTSLGPDAEATAIVDGVNDVMSSLTGGSISLSVGEIAAVLSAPRREAEAELASILNARGGIEFSNTGHTAVDVPLSAFGAGADLYGGIIDNTTVAHLLAEAMGLSFPDASPAESFDTTGNGCSANSEDGNSQYEEGRIGHGWTFGNAQPEPDFLFA